MNRISINGLELAFERRGRGTPLALFHGYPLDHSIWEPVVPLLEKDFDLILPDMRGFGESGTTQAPYLLTDMAADIAALLDSLGNRKTFIAGHSMGGYIALAFAQAYPQRTLGIGLIASQALADPPERKIARAQDADYVLANGVRQTAETMSAKLTADVALQAKLKEIILRQPPEALAGALRAMAARPDSTSFLSYFSSRLVSVHGLEDQLIPVERTRELKTIVKNGEFIEIERVGHMPMMEAPTQTVEALQAFLLD